MLLPATLLFQDMGIILTLLPFFLLLLVIVIVLLVVSHLLLVTVIHPGIIIPQLLETQIMLPVTIPLALAFVIQLQVIILRLSDTITPRVATALLPQVLTTPPLAQVLLLLLATPTPHLAATPPLLV